MEEKEIKACDEKNTATDLDMSLELLERNDNKKNEASPETSPLLFSKRLIVAIMLLLCYANFQLLRYNMNIAVVEMAYNKSITEDNVTITIPPEFDWDMKTIGVVTSIVGYGGIFAFMGGFLTNMLGGAMNCALCMFISGISTLLHPAALSQNFYLFLFCRFLNGVSEALFYVSTTDVSVRWYPKKERSRLISFSFNGYNIGSAIVYPIFGYVAVMWGWRMVFYVTGCISLIISTLFFLNVKNSPTQSKGISKKELAFILSDTDIDTNEDASKDGKKLKARFLYMSIFTSIPIWTLLINQFIDLWIATILEASIPLYTKDATKKNTDEVGLLASVPSAVHVFTLPIVAMFMDYWNSRGSVSTTNKHKILLGAAYFSGSFFFVIITFVPNFAVSLICFICIQIVSAFVPLVLILDAISLAPDYSSHISGFSTLFLSAGGIGAQTITGFMTTEHSIEQWNNCFLLTAGISIFGGLTYILFGSSEQQPWSKITNARNHADCKNSNTEITSDKASTDFVIKSDK